ncbi:helix-turn-helix domain-containing protein [Halomarina pelagica]|uniref:helix-turn-helix domain-containing protein n=1 Tax=Halomarina pelagica TaxID=2961599 RepID=UPI0020C1F3B5|nr:helix-turn-helix domain-containing protein [Halomarina sp. BND7]
MGLLVEYRIVSPFLRSALQSVPSMAVEVEDVRLFHDEPVRLVCCASDGDFDAFEAALPDDPTVESFAVLGTTDDRRFYRLSLSAYGEACIVYSTLADLDIALLDNRTTIAGSWVRVRVPSRDELRRLREAYEERDVSFRLERLAHLDVPARERYQLTERQREALVAAYEAGYFEVPRECSLGDVADDLDISKQALSARLRRGEANLIRNTVIVDETDK